MHARHVPRDIVRRRRSGRWHPALAASRQRAGRLEQRVVPRAGAGIVGYQARARKAAQALGERAQIRRDDGHVVGRERGREGVAVALRHLVRQEQHVGLLGRQQLLQHRIGILARDRERNVRELRHGFGGATHDAEPQRQPAFLRVARARRDDVQALARGEPAERDDAYRGLPRCGRGLRVGPDEDVQRRPHAPVAPRDVLRWRDHALGSEQHDREELPPRVHAEVPRDRRACERRTTTRFVGSVDEIFRPRPRGRGAKREIVVQREVVRHAERARQVQHCARKAVHVVVMDARDADAAQQRGQRIELAVQVEVRDGAGTRVHREHAFRAACRARFQPDDLAMAAQEPCEIVHVPAHTAAPGVTHEQHARQRRLPQAPELRTTTLDRGGMGSQERGIRGDGREMAARREGPRIIAAGPLRPGRPRPVHARRLRPAREKRDVGERACAVSAAERSRGWWSAACVARSTSIASRWARASPFTNTKSQCSSGPPGSIFW